MQKISSILPSSPRVTAVDLKESSPVRAGTPGFGRTSSQSTKRDPNGVDSIRDSISALNQQKSWRTKEDQNAGIAKEISNKFFNRAETPAEEYAASAPVPATTLAHSMGMIEAAPARTATSPAVSEFGGDEADNGTEADDNASYYPKGSFIDVEA